MWANAQRDSRPAEYRWHLCKSSIIPFLVRRHKAWLTIQYRRMQDFAHKVNFALVKTLSEGKTLQKCIYSVTAQETAKYRAKFG